MIKHETAMKVMALLDLGRLTLSTLTPVLEEVRDQGLEEAANKIIDQYASDGEFAEKCARAIREMKSREAQHPREREN